MTTLLVANRGEIAVRVMRSARQLGLRTVAVHSEADASAMHVAAADMSVPIGGSPARDSYLRADRILEAARLSGADAIHPGYGFLSENADFAKAVEAAGLRWVGPAAETIRLMGDKDAARRTAQGAGVPVVPGSRRFAPGALEGLSEAAAQVGFPLLIKAAAGGGGIGMQVAQGPEGLEALARSVQEAAEKSFGSGDIYLERFLPRARHIEVQVFGFGDGSAIALGERDCSVQRRFQKVIEEAPAPDLPAATASSMADAALSLCRSVRYAGAGTVEFILDTSTNAFFFLEMNTRIQVEHPVSEAVTGVDLVAMQLALAGTGNAEPFRAQPEIRGAAIECRLYAENPARKFFPSPGRLTRFALPEQSANIRVDTGYREGDTVTPFYDPLLAKIIASGASRSEAIQHAEEAVGRVEVEGLVSNRDFLLACLRHPSFARGEVHTRFIDEHAAELLPTPREAR